MEKYDWKPRNGPGAPRHRARGNGADARSTTRSRRRAYGATERGVSPNLSRFGEAVGRGAGDFCRHSRCIELEHLRFAPGVGGIVRDVHGDISDDANTALVGVAFKLAPLAVKTILREGMETCALSIDGVVKNRDIIARELFFPGMPRCSAVHIFHRCECTVGVEPGACALGESAKSILTLASVFDECVIHLLNRGSVFLQEVDVACKGGRASVGGVMFIGWIEGQDLPVRCAHFLQMIDKSTCGSAQRTRLTLTGDGGDVAHHAPTVAKRLLQALARMKIDSSAAQGVQRYRGHAIGIRAEGAPGNEVGRGFSHKRNAHRMRVAGNRD